MAQESPLKLDPNAEALIKNLELNSHVRTIDEGVRSLAEPELQLAVLMICAALAFGRILAKHKVFTGPRKKLILGRAMKDFADKVRRYGWNTPAPTIVVGPSNTN